MGRKLLIVASKRYGDYVKEIAESMGCFEKIAFVDNEREGAIGKLEDVESFYPEYNCAIAACDDGVERLECWCSAWSVPLFERTYCTEKSNL